MPSKQESSHEGGSLLSDKNILRVCVGILVFGILGSKVAIKKNQNLLPFLHVFLASKIPASFSPAVVNLKISPKSFR